MTCCFTAAAKHVHRPHTAPATEDLQAVLAVYGVNVTLEVVGVVNGEMEPIRGDEPEPMVVGALPVLLAPKKKPPLGALIGGAIGERYM